MTWYIYDTKSSKILKREGKKHYLLAEYATKGAAEASLTRRQKAWEKRALELQNSEYPWERARAEAKAANGPLYTAGLAEREYYHANIERFETTYSMMDKERKNPIRQSVNTPAYMDPGCESYWSM